MSNAAELATRFAGRPLLLLPRAAEDLGHRIQAVDARAFTRPSRLGAVLSKLVGGRGERPVAMDDDGYTPPPLEERLAYSPLWAGEPDDVGYCWTLCNGVALMEADTALSDRGEDFCGVVYHGYDTLLAGMRQALADPRVGGLFLRLNSPGGVVAGGLPALAAFMRGARATGNTAGKPIHVYADMAASAAYWIAAQADFISAPSCGLVGSIGAVWIHTDASGALSQAGLKVTAVQFGVAKTDGAGFKPLSPTAEADVQAEIDQLGRDFIADVVLGRPKLTSDALLATQARVFQARMDDPTRSGLALGFVDAIESEEAAFARLAERVEPSSSAATPPGALPMAATPANSPAAQAAQASQARKAERTRLQARLAELDGADAAPAAGTGAEDQPEADAAPADDVPPVETPDVEPDDEGDPDRKKPAAASEVQKISASAEGKAHPQAALAAIGSGMTFDQFKASVQAHASAPRRGGALRDAMAGAPRLAADGAKAEGGQGSGLAAAAARLREARSRA